LKILNKELQEINGHKEHTMTDAEFKQWVFVIKNVCKSQNIGYSRVLEMHVGASSEVCLIRNLDGDYTFSNPMGLLISYPKIKPGDITINEETFTQNNMHKNLGNFNITHYSYCANVSALDTELMKLMPDSLVDQYIKHSDQLSRYESIEHICTNKILFDWYIKERKNYTKHSHEVGDPVNVDGFIEYILQDVQPGVYVYPENRKGILSHIYEIDKAKTTEVEHLQSKYKSLTIKIQIESDDGKIKHMLEQQNRLRQMIHDKTKGMVLKKLDMA